MRKRTLLILLTFSSTYSLLAQDPPRPEIDIQQFIEEMFQVPDQDINYEDLYESLYQLYLNPIDLNDTKKPELSTLYQLSVLQINNLLEYISEHGPMISIYELQAVDGFDQQTIQSILPFVRIKSTSDHQTKGHLAKRIAQEENAYLILRSGYLIESQKGFTRKDSSRYQGSPYSLYGRFLSRHSKDFSLGLTFEKDAGEALAWNPQKNQFGFDYYSFHLMLEEKGRFKKVVLGDFQMQFGQGLVLGSGFSPGKGAETITTVKRNNTGIRPYTSVLESGFMRGAAVTYSLSKQWDVSVFYSRLHQDANVQNNPDTESYDEYVSSIIKTGLHRNHKELASRKQILEQSYGANLSFHEKKNANLQSGITWISTHYSTPVLHTPSNYNQFEFTGKSNYTIGIYANYNWHNFLFFGELARSKSNGHAYIGGFMASLTPTLSTSFAYRNYDRDYHSFYANSFAENSRSINEKGFYWGIQFRPSKVITLSAFYDHFSFPWLRYRADAPTDGYEYLLRSDFRLNKKINLYLQYRAQSKEVTLSTNDNTKQLAAGVKHSLASNIDFQLSPYIGLKSRIQYSSYDLDGNRSDGVAIVQDLNLTIGKLRLSGRFAIFDTEDYENRQYVYEKDLLYAFSIPAYYGQGTRSYILLQYRPFRKLTLWVKYGRYLYSTDTESIGSGNNEISGNLKSELKLQLRYKF